MKLNNFNLFFFLCIKKELNRFYLLKNIGKDWYFLENYRNIRIMWIKIRGGQ